mmetsp:Transcript_43550/g.121094  ORF Transcript_43550/g.121094 Transcript_43550/m.121094 type:complete len:265 (+) Transcript_43550:214-1008(+)
MASKPRLPSATGEEILLVLLDLLPASADRGNPADAAEALLPTRDGERSRPPVVPRGNAADAAEALLPIREGERSRPAVAPRADADDEVEGLRGLSPMAPTPPPPSCVEKDTADPADAVDRRRPSPALLLEPRLDCAGDDPAPVAEEATEPRRGAKATEERRCSGPPCPCNSGGNLSRKRCPRSAWPKPSAKSCARRSARALQAVNEASAPLSKSRCTTASWPPDAASINGVMSPAVRLSTSALLSKRNSTTAAWPLAAAACNAV